MSVLSLKSKWSVVATLSVAAALSFGCDISIDEHGTCSFHEASAACENYCDMLQDCGNIERAEVRECRAHCDAAAIEDPGAVRDASECVLEQECKPLSRYRCDAPDPFGEETVTIGSLLGNDDDDDDEGFFDDDDDASVERPSRPPVSPEPEPEPEPEPSESSQSDAGASEPPPTMSSPNDALKCSSHHDCDAYNDCVDGECKTRCYASCQCEDGLMCVEGYCGEGPAPEQCQTPCDCPAGQDCVTGQCE